MKKDKKLLYLSFVPFIITIILGIILEISYKEGFIDFLNAYIFDLIFKYTILFILLIVGIIYQLYYLFKSKVKLGKILFVISIGIWVVYFLSGIYYFIFGYNSCFLMNCHDYTGFEAVKEGMFWTLLSFSVIPVLPISLIIIIANIIRITKNTKKN